MRQGPGKIQTTRKCGICAQTGHDKRKCPNRLKEQSADPFADFRDDGYHPPAEDDDEDECQADPDGEGEKTGGGAAENFRATRCPAPRKVKWNPQFLESLHKCRIDAEKFFVGGDPEPEVLDWAWRESWEREHPDVDLSWSYLVGRYCGQYLLLI